MPKDEAASMQYLRAAQEQLNRAQAASVMAPEDPNAETYIVTQWNLLEKATKAALEEAKQKKKP